MSTDVTPACAAELRHLRAALADAERRNTDRAAFIAITSHEIREPMNGVLGMARLLLDTQLDEEQRRYTDTIVESAEALLTIVNDILDLSRVDAGRLTIAQVTFDLPALLGRVVDLLGARARAKGLVLNARIDSNVARLCLGDPGRIRQVLINLAGNAIKFTQAGEIELVCARSNAGMTSISVQDTGPGIPEESFDTLFTAFAQGNSDCVRLYGGSGLGLMIARRLAEAMGGTLKAVKPKTGSCFVLSLPLRPAPDIGTDSPDHPRTLAGVGVLVIGAEARSRERVCGLASSWSMSVWRAIGVAEAMVLLLDAADRRAPIDVVICDGELVDGRGEELAQRMRAQPALAHAAFVLLVASGMRGDAAAAAAAGVDAYLPKPISATTLFECLIALRKPDRTAGPLITTHSLADTRSPRLRVLLVDDNEVNLRLAGIMLERAGHQVSTAPDGSAAVEAVARGNFDLVMMDIQMPGMDGLEASRRIRNLPDRKRAAVPIVAVTANAMSGDAAQCAAAGMNGHLAKPFDRADLLGTVEQWSQRA